MNDVPSNPSRREFVAITAAAGLAAATGRASAADATKVVEENVEIGTRDGSSDAAFYHPANGAHPGVLIWTDALGLRPSFREMGRRLASEGYAVLIPNPYYRTQKSPVFANAADFNFQNEADRAKLPPLMGPLTAAGAAESDAQAYIAFLDAQKSVDKSKKIGVQGYCMGGALVMRAAATVPARVGAAASFHGGGLVTDKPDSPHLLAPRIKARLYIAIAGNDDAKQPDAKDKLKEAFAAAKVPAEVEVFANTLHGWCVTDTPPPVYSHNDAERAWQKLLALYKKGLA